MAEYYPLLARAVAALPHKTPEARQLIYARARQALLKQLGSIQPSLAQADIDREAQSLDAAVARLENELAASGATPAKTTPSPAAAAPPAESKAEAAAPAKAAPAEPHETAEKGAAKPAAPRAKPVESKPGEADSAESKPAESKPIETRPVEPKAVEAKPAPAEPAGRPAERIRAEVPPVSVAAETHRSERDSVTRRVTASDRTRNLLTGFGAAKVPAGAPAQPEEAEGGGEEFAPYGLEARDALAAKEVVRRPAAPQPIVPARKQKPVFIVAIAVGLLIAGIAYWAWILRDTPDELARRRAALPQQTETGGGKITERVGAPGEKNKPANPVPPETQASDRQVPVAYRAALLVEAPAEESKVKTYIGNVVWRLDNSSSGPGQPLTSEVRADIDIRDAKFQAVVSMQKNNDAALPASHTIKVRFLPAADSPIGSVKQIGVMEMRREGATDGAPLSGVPVPIMENSFLVGLTRGMAEQSNIDSLKSTGWIDIRMRLADGRLAKIALEKGAAGDRVIGDAIKSWAGN
jgi:hypothetical protein